MKINTLLMATALTAVPGVVFAAHADHGASHHRHGHHAQHRRCRGPASGKRLSKMKSSVLGHIRQQSKRIHKMEVCVKHAKSAKQLYACRVDTRHHQFRRPQRRRFQPRQYIAPERGYASRGRYMPQNGYAPRNGYPGYRR